MSFSETVEVRIIQKYLISQHILEYLSLLIMYKMEVRQSIY